MEGLYDGEQRGNANATSGTHNCAYLLNLSSLPKGTYNVVYIVSFVEGNKFFGRLSHTLYHQSNGSLVEVCTCNG